MVSVTVPFGIELLSTAGLPLMEQLMNAEAGAEQVKLTEPLYPLRPSMVIVEVPLLLVCAMVTRLPNNEKSAAVGFPLLQLFKRTLASMVPRPVT